MSGKNHPSGPCDILDDGSVIIQEGDNPLLTLEVVAQSQHQFAEIWGRSTYPRFGRMEYDRPTLEDEYYVPGSRRYIDCSMIYSKESISRLSREDVALSSWRRLDQGCQIDGSRWEGEVSEESAVGFC
jgi:hypothetical protein